jgi:hypothetical protein
MIRAGSAVLLLLLLIACSGGVSRNPTEQPTAEPAWPEEYAEWVCAANQELRLNGVPALDDLIDAAQLYDAGDMVDAADRLGDSAAQTIDFLDLAPRWGPGRSLVNKMRAWMQSLARGANQISRGISSDSASVVQDGIDDIVAANKKGTASNRALRQLKSRTGFSCD